MPATMTSTSLRGLKQNLVSVNRQRVVTSAAAPKARNVCPSVSHLRRTQLSSPNFVTFTAHRAAAKFTKRSSQIIWANSGVMVEESFEPGSHVVLKVTVPQSTCQQEYNSIMKELKKDVSIKGFRKGAKIPQKLLIQSYGVKNVRAAVIEQMLTNAIPKAMESVAKRAIQDSEKIETDLKEIEEAFAGADASPTGDAHFSIGVDVVPEVKWTAPYRSMAVEVEEAGNEGTDAAKVKLMIHGRRKELGELRIVSDRGLEVKDVAVLDFKANCLNEDGSLGDEIPGVRNPNWQLDTLDGADFLPGIVDGLVGMKPGEEREYDLVFPESWPQASLVGVTGRFSAKMKELFSKELPPLEDDIADKLLPGCTTIAEVEEKLAMAQKQSTFDQTLNKVREALTQQLADIVDVDPPEYLVQEQGRQMYSIRLLEMQQKGQVSQEAMQTLTSIDMVNNFVGQNREDAARLVKITLATEAIQELEKLEVTEEELQAGVKEAIEDMVANGMEYDEDSVKGQTQELISGQKVLDFLSSTCKVDLLPMPKEEEEEILAKAAKIEGEQGVLEEGPALNPDGSIMFKFD
ncbi:hypothetical protein CYMTET_50034 [Cymbomonas tetramitiformis]|uniref:peptidylprolyl isomerase n=1 Tax=Cymbomonas tetramitiformis TaxID=36881 RepID=A0AAE0EU41_9CHLO|nr:hypothetical protein CYMTET_50034 [Cymbomonas tetramitiformis]